MQLTVQSVTRGEKSYKVETDQGRFYVGFKGAAGIEQTVGKVIEARTSPSEDGRINFINGFSLVGAGQTMAPTIEPAKNSKDRWWAPFVSNTVAHAIQSGLIKDTADLTRWAAHAYDTAHKLDNGDSTPF